MQVLQGFFDHWNQWSLYINVKTLLFLCIVYGEKEGLNSRYIFCPYILDYLFLDEYFLFLFFTLYSWEYVRFVTNPVFLFLFLFFWYFFDIFYFFKIEKYIPTPIDRGEEESSQKVIQFLKNTIEQIYYTTKVFVCQFFKHFFQKFLHHPEVHVVVVLLSLQIQWLILQILMLK